MRVYIVNVDGNDFKWYSLDDALWQVDVMRRWGIKVKSRSHVSMRSYIQED